MRARRFLRQRRHPQCPPGGRRPPATLLRRLRQRHLWRAFLDPGAPPNPPFTLIMKKFLHEYRHFLSYPRDLQILLLTNLIYAFVLPVIDVFVGAYVMRNSHDVKMVVIYQLAVYTGIPFTLLINGFLLQCVQIKRLYSAGMLLSGAAMALMMSLGTLNMRGERVGGLMMGMS